MLGPQPIVPEPFGKVQARLRTLKPCDSSQATRPTGYVFAHARAFNRFFTTQAEGERTSRGLN